MGKLVPLGQLFIEDLILSFRHSSSVFKSFTRLCDFLFQLHTSMAMASEEKQGETYISILKKLEKLPSATLPKQKIFRLPREQLDEINKKAYEPYIVSIGPYHHGVDRLKAMEGHKLRFLKRLLDRYGDRAQEYVDVMQGMVQEARNYYSQSSLDIPMQEFSDLMVVDGCFIVELIHQWREKKLDPSVFKGGLVLKSILRDLALVENQLPFFVLCKILDITVKDKKVEYIKSLLEMFEYTMPGLRVNEIDDSLTLHANHLLHLLQLIWSPQIMDQKLLLLDLEDFESSFIHSATELSEAGIQFVSKVGGLFDIEFKKEKGVLEIPTMIVEDNTESIYHNIIAFEQCYSTDGGHLTSYCRLMDCLINSGKDVELLRRCGIIVNYLGDDQAVAAMFNRLGVQVGLSGNDFFYAQLFHSVNEYYNKKWNKWKATLRRDYCNSPWAFISVVAAVFLLLLTLLQTIFAVSPHF